MSGAADGERLPPIPLSQQTPAQRRVSENLLAGPRGRVSGPFAALLRSPELCDRTQRLGEYLRYQSVLPPRLRELAILATARHWRQNYEWQAHAPIAERAGLSRSLIEALAAGNAIESAPADAAVVLRFCSELHEQQQVSDAAYASALELLAEDGVIELGALCGYYALLAMIMNIARTAIPAGAEAPFIEVPFTEVPPHPSDR